MSFLSLPPTLRKQIYHEAGLVHSCNINFSPEENIYSLFSSLNLSILLSLLRSCRSVYLEVLPLFYSTNKFFIRFRDTQSLRPLRSLGVDALASLQYLTVHLNSESCEVLQPCSNVLPTWSKLPNLFQFDNPLTTSSRLHHDILQEWQDTARFIAACVQPFKLRLYIVCDVVEVKSARRVIEPLQDFPILADCGIRLGRRPNRTLQELAKDTATKATGHDATRLCSPFRFLDLPPELRQQILGLTDLVAPLREVQWTPTKGFSLQYMHWQCLGPEAGCPPNLHYACRFRNCWEWSNSGCFCRRYHSAFSSKCHCWLPPWPIFLVCRALREDAKPIFFSKNRFVVLPSEGCGHVVTHPPSRLEPSMFLKDVVPFTALPFLKFVEIVFPPFDGDYIKPGEPAFRDWISTIDQVKGQLNLPQLTLRVYMTDLPQMEAVTSTFRHTVTSEQKSTIYRSYVTAFYPLQALKGVNRFFAHLACPVSWTPRGGLCRHDEADFSCRHVISLERRLEQMVMGEDYDAEAVGKREMEKSEKSMWLMKTMLEDPYSAD